LRQVEAQEAFLFRRVVMSLILSIILLGCTWWFEDLETEFISELDRVVVLAVWRGFPFAFYYDPKFLPTVPHLIFSGLILDFVFWFIVSYVLLSLAERSRRPPLSLNLSIQGVSIVRR